ncbi:hypothetical protein F0562_033065 [Nyssa sinensis]|uniref:Uncharacterized protein n=1 Tax=Nyssa sinensis TaxID=561372 RepID=A0A5J5ARF0_9ASTE|nr:hypothetical protein F0562_033065 [Nyssa sinensis]
MEPSKVLGGTEECSSSESGWTKYIVSSIHEDDNCDDDHSTDKKGDDDSDNNNESDDSMASDASSRPIHPELLCECNEGSRVMGHFKHLKDEDHRLRKTVLPLCQPPVAPCDLILKDLWMWKCIKNHDKYLAGVSQGILLAQPHPAVRGA